MQETEKAIAALKAGKVIYMPTETVPAFAVDANNQAAIERLYQIKKRDPKKPFAVFVKDLQAMTEIAEVNNYAKKIYTDFMPGPITIILKRKLDILAKNLNSVNDTIAIRIPNHEFALSITEKFNQPIAATSANLSGENVADVEYIKSYFKDQVEIFDVQSQESKIASTIIDLTVQPFKIIRQGEISLKEL